MKKIVKMGIAIAAMSGIGYLAYKGVKKLMDKVELEASHDAECCCDDCDCDCCATSDCCECSDGCKCHENDKVANEEPVEIVVEEKPVEAAAEPVEAPANDETV